MSQKIEQLMGGTLIEKSKADYIKEKFSTFTDIIEEWSNKAKSIVVTDESQKDLMSQAKEGRLLLKAKRIEVEKARKSLKEQSLNEGRLIDSVAKYLTELIEPAEKHLELQEKFIEIREQQKRLELKQKRLAVLAPYWEVFDASIIQLDLITDEAFETILNGAKISFENKKSEELRLENERKEKEQKEKIFRERTLEFAEYKSFYSSDTDKPLTLETTEEDYQSIMETVKKRKSEYDAEQKRIAKENEQLKKQNKELKTIIKTTPTPASEPQTIIKRGVATSSPNPTEHQDEEMIMVSRKEYESLKSKYNIAYTALKSVFAFIVPKNLRDLTYKAMEDIDQVDLKNGIIINNKK
jgi:hypothetical protein